VVNGKPVTLVITPEAGVPRAGVTKVGDVRVPVALVSTRAEGVPKFGVVKTGELKEPVALVKTGAVSVLLVSVLVDVSVTTFVGVIMSDKLAMCYASSSVGQSSVLRSGKLA
jgi:hypothetical protein